MGFRFIFLPFLLCLGCFKYSFTGSLPSHIKNVAIPLFENNTSYTGVNQELTNKTVDLFVLDNSLSVTSESQADIIISGTVASIIQRPAILSEGETVEEYHMVVNVRIKCEDIKNNKVLWEKTLSQFGVLAQGGGIEEQDTAIDDAVEKITVDILNNTLGYW